MSHHLKKIMNHRNRVLFACCLGIFLATMAAYFPTLWAEVVKWDDDISIYQNEHITQLSRENILWMFAGDSNQIQKYAPFYWVSLALTYAFSGLDPFAYHLVNLLMHATSAVLLFFILRAQFCLRFSLAHSRICLAALIAALFWSLHPLRTNVVALAANRSYCQAVLFIMISFVFYIRAMSREETPVFSGAAFWLSVFFFAASLLSFPIGLGFPAAFLAYDLYNRKRLLLSLKKIILEKIPFGLVTAVILLVNLALRASAKDDTASLYYTGLDHIQILKPFYLLVFYFVRPWFPVNLSPVNTAIYWNPPNYYLLGTCVLLVLGITAFLLLSGKRFFGPLLLWFLHLAILFPILEFTKRYQFPAERYAYLQGTLWSFALGGLLCLLYEKRIRRLVFWGVHAGLAAAGAVLLVMSVRYTLVWNNNLSLYTHIIRSLGDDPYRSDIYWRMGMAHEDLGQMEKALESYNTSLAIYPRYEPVLLHRGVLLAYLGQYEAAARDLKKVAKKYKGKEHLHLGMAYIAAGQGTVDEAAVILQKAFVEGFPRALVYEKLGQAYENRRQTRKAAKAYNLMGKEHLISGRYKKAEQAFGKILALFPDNMTAHYNLACALSLAGEGPQACQRLKQCLEAGFVTPAQLERDPDLEYARSHACYSELVPASGQ